jgi:dsDNA-specific endonuclease/ATPase MutS2
MKKILKSSEIWFLQKVHLQIGLKKVLKNSLSTEVRHMTDIIKNESKLEMHSRWHGKPWKFGI